MFRDCRCDCIYDRLRLVLSKLITKIPIPMFDSLVGTNYQHKSLNQKKKGVGLSTHVHGEVR